MLQKRKRAHHGCHDGRRDGTREAGVPSGSGSDKDACRDSIDARTLAEMDRAIANMEAGAVGKEIDLSDFLDREA